MSDTVEICFNIRFRLPHSLGMVALLVGVALSVSAQTDEVLYDSQPRETVAGRLAVDDGAGLEVGSDITFNRDVLPVLSENCFQCHGPDSSSREADLRLDRQENALAELPSGVRAIVPRNSAKSELFSRITDPDPDVRMPPADFHKSLTNDEIETLRRWIDAGANWQIHWSFMPPQAVDLPAVKQATWRTDPLDDFILERLEAARLSPAPQADRTTLVRRLFLDLTGLPPTLEQLDRVLFDRSTGWYERLVDKLLASPHFGERLAQDWLDAARYGDTNGYHYDSDRQMWLWRDYVIDAFNENMPFDQFTIELLAGDLIPNRTERALIASGFHRNTTFNEEGGADAAEFLTKYAVDRASTTATVWLGLTMGCAECHDHKYDPISQKDFYSLYAFFNSVEHELGAQGHNTPLPPIYNVLTNEQKQTIERVRDEIARLNRQAIELVQKIDYVDPADEVPVDELSGADEFIWVEDHLPKGASPIGATWRWVTRHAHPVFSGSVSMYSLGDPGMRRHHFISATERLELDNDTVFFAHVWLDPQDPPEALMMEYRYGLATTWDYRAYWGEDKFPLGKDGTTSRLRVGDLPETGKWARIEVKADDLDLPAGAKLASMVLTQFSGKAFWDRVGATTASTAARVPTAEEPTPHQSQRNWEREVAAARFASPGNRLMGLIHTPDSARTPAQLRELRLYYLRHVYEGSRELVDPFELQINELKRQWREAEIGGTPTMVMQEMQNRTPAFIHMRGNFQSRGEPVAPNVPEVLPPLADDQPQTRLGLAKWLVDIRNPLTSRVFVNRVWQHLFGTGLVKSANDFGVQGEDPSHPELLDFLAVTFMDGWDIKMLYKRIVMSSTYRQSSTYRPEAQEIDPFNRLLHRAPRFRVPAEQVRDIALAASGLLDLRNGGPSVMPFQPEAYYVGKREAWNWDVSKGSDRYRRGLYTFWRRTTLYPSFQIFDAPSREFCTVTRPQTITPLQALVTLNDPVFVEAARALAQLTQNHGGENFDSQLQYAFRRAMSRVPTAAEAYVLRQAWQRHQKHFTSESAAALKLTTDPDDGKETSNDSEPTEGAEPTDNTKPNDGAEPTREEMQAVAESAAWVAICNSILNLEETFIRE